MAELDEQLKLIAELRTQCREYEEALYRARLEPKSDPGQLLKVLRDCEERLQAAIGSLYQRDPHPRSTLRSLDDRTPFLLLPVRLETIFVPVQSGTELWVRIYPDDIAIHTHERVLTGSEVTAGELYWT